MKLRGRGVLITGGSQGFGKAVAKACVDAGADVLLCARDATEVESTYQELRSRAENNQRIAAHVADVSDPESVSRLIALAEKELPSFQGIVNSAGVYGPKGRVED